MEQFNPTALSAYLKENIFIPMYKNRGIEDEKEIGYLATYC